MGRLIAAVAATAALLMVLAGCGGDPDQKLLSEGARAARDAASEVSTARLAAQSLLDHRLWSQPATQLVSESEQALGTVATTFDAQQPETEKSRHTYDQISEALSTAETGVTDLRIALKNNDLATVAQQLNELEKTAAQLDQLGELAQ
jgi:hypothetical protein